MIRIKRVYDSPGPQDGRPSEMERSIWAEGGRHSGIFEDVR